MSFKYDLIQNITGVRIVDLFIIYNVNTNFFFVYGLLLTLWMILYFVFNVFNDDDRSLSFVQSAFSILLLSVPLFYMGLSAGVTVVHAWYMIALSSIIAFGTGLLYYDRTDRT